MKQLVSIFLLGSILMLTSCKSTKTSTSEKPLKETIDEKNRSTVSLLNRIRRLPGVALKNGVPSFTKNNNSVLSNNEPLYVLDDYAVGNSFSSVNGLVKSINVKKVEALSSSEASIYGSRAASGVIKITTYQ